MAPVSALVASLVLLLAGGSAAPAAQAAQNPLLTLSISGRGWGHGVGMSQWGAFGFAKRGATYDQILAHYYQGTELGKTAGARMRVLVVESAPAITVASEAPFTVVDGDGATRELEAGSYRFGDEEPVVLPMAFTPGDAPLEVAGVLYRGTVELSAAGNRLRAINTVPLESYLLGVVPREVPASWPPHALRAQAVAARSYALATRKTSGDFDVYADVRSQVYGGIEAEQPETTFAVQDTRGEVVLYEDRVATTYFFSTSGGRTVDVAEAWPGATPTPYLVSVEDPYDFESPVHTWGPVVAAGPRLKRALELSAVPVGARVERGQSRRVTDLVLTLANGSEAVVSAGTVRAALGLRSTWFSLAQFSLAPPAKSPVVYRTKTRLTGFVRGLKGVTLQRRPVGGEWESVGPVKGTFTVPFRAEATADYRLVTSRLQGAALRVRVAPRVNLKPPEGGVLRGTVRPVFPGATVVVQLQEGSRWVEAGRATVDDAGAFEVALELAPGTYRARLAPGQGFAPGVSRSLSIAP